MKLYATTTSERASKGQGGNDYLDIVVKDDNQEQIARLRVYPKKDDVGEFTDIIFDWAEHVYINGQHGLDAQIITKGKNNGWSECNHYVIDKKGLCIRCSYNTLHLTNKELKGKSQKGEMCKICGKDFNKPSGACPDKHNLN